MSSGYYQHIAEENRLKMIHSYFAIHHTEPIFAKDEAIMRGFIKIDKKSDKEKILDEINYDDIKSVSEGIKQMEKLAMITDEQYIHKNYDPEKVNICQDLWNEHNKLRNVLIKLQSNQNN